MIKQKVYVIILNFNGWNDTIACLESVFQNVYNNFQVILCDNGSTDESVDKLIRWANGSFLINLPGKILQQESLCSKPIMYNTVKFKDIGKEDTSLTAPLIFIETGKNLGFAGGINAGLRLALAQNDFAYAWILNNDTVVCKDSLVELVRTMNADKSIGICGSRLMSYQNPEQVQSLGGRYNKLLGTSSHIVETKVLPNMDYVVGASMLVSQKFIKKIGLLEEDYFLYYEDLDWAVRSRGIFKVACSLNSVVYHKEGAATGGNNKDKGNKSKLADYYSIRNRVLFARKYSRMYLPTVYLGLVATMVKRIYRKQYGRLWMILKIMLIGR